MTEAALLLAQQVAPALPGGGQPDLLEARQMQALSLGVHIPLVCFGIAFPVMFLFVEVLYLRTGNETYKELAKRWSKVALVLFAVGVVTGTILSFEMGLLWPQFMATFGSVFGFAFGLEGIFFFLEAIFLAIYVYGWERFPRGRHFLVGLPVAIAGVGGSTCVIAVNGWMNQPRGFEVRDGDVVIVPDGYHPFTATHGDDAYYLNALAGDRRTMACSFDPDLDWVRATWSDMAPDPRIPLVPPRVDSA
jgi:cytochrome d ubiquinol oxidase subunit I